ncbi:hypothetical protein Taro_017860, partial [Colocasia esculenta]|nr:hypothetical protein [Colocasia esculenta]
MAPLDTRLENVMSHIPVYSLSDKRDPMEQQEQLHRLYHKYTRKEEDQALCRHNMDTFLPFLGFSEQYQMLHHLLPWVYLSFLDYPKTSPAVNRTQERARRFRDVTWVPLHRAVFIAPYPPCFAPTRPASVAALPSLAPCNPAAQPACAKRRHLPRAPAPRRPVAWPPRDHLLQRHARPVLTPGPPSPWPLQPCVSLASQAHPPPPCPLPRRQPTLGQPVSAFALPLPWPLPPRVSPCQRKAPALFAPAPACIALASSRAHQCRLRLRQRKASTPSPAPALAHAGAFSRTCAP